MTVIDTEVRVAVSADDAYYRATGGYSNSGTNHPLGDHTNAAYRPYWGLRFKIPSIVDPGTITSVTLKLMSAATATMGATFIRVEQNGDGAVWDSSTRRPDTVWTAIGATFETSWSGSVTTDAYTVSPDFSADVITAMATWDYDNDYLHVALGPKGTTTNAPNHYTFDYTGTDKDPILVITHDVTPANNSVTTVAPAVAAEPSLGTAISNVDTVSYHDGIGVSAARDLDLYFPTGGVGAMPADGWPLVVYVHGGSWTAGTENDDDDEQISASVRRGYAFASIDYKLSSTAANTYSHPHQVQDVICALKWLADRSDVDGTQIVVTGYSAGGEIGLAAALAVHDGTTYTWADTGDAGDPRNADGVDAFPNWRFTQGRDTTGITIKGVYLWDSPHDITDLWTYNTLQRSSMKAYAGRTSADPDPSWSAYNNELVVSALIDGLTTGASRTETDNVYAGQAHIPRFPIGYVAAYEYNAGAGNGANVTLNPQSAIDDIVLGLDNVGYPTVADLATGSTLDVNYGNLSIHTANKSASSNTTWIDYLPVHDRIYMWWDFEGKFGPWLESLDAAPYPDAVAVAVAVPTPAVAAGTSSDNGVTTTAPGAAAAITDPAVAVADAVEVTPSAPVVATAITDPGVEVYAAGEVLTVAPGAAAAITDPAAAVSDNVTVPTTAPVAAAAITDPAVAVAADVTTTAPVAATAITDPGAAVAEAVGVTTTAPVIAFDVTVDPSFEAAVYVTPAAVLVAVQVGVWQQLIAQRTRRTRRRPDFTRAARRESTPS